MPTSLANWLPHYTSDPMTTPKDLKPTQKLLVIDILKSLGMDVSKWAETKGGPSRAASNPKYCYNWSFLQPGEFVVACLWYPGLKQKGNRLYFELSRNNWRSNRTEPGTGSTNKRANDFDRHLWLAYSEQLPLRVIIVQGMQRDPTAMNAKASSVKGRLLDEVPWAVTEYDIASGACLLERGAKPTSKTISAEDVELSGFEGKSRPRFVLHRRREGAMRRAKIAEALSKSGRLVCEVPKCEFDFAQRYGELGKGYAQVHHLIPLHKAPKEGRQVLLKDLAIVCANCHAMIHAAGECRPLEGLISK
jgi:5-methylcytosine-specific restriction enzyme A